MSGWTVRLRGVTLAGSADHDGIDAAGCLSVPPAGLGLPPRRTEDVTYPQRDGVRHFADWYEPRIITLEDVSVCPDDCPKCPGARQKVRDILQAWSRQCDDVELVVWSDCAPVIEPVLEGVRLDRATSDYICADADGIDWSNSTWDASLTLTSDNWLASGAYYLMSAYDPGAGVSSFVLAWFGGGSNLFQLHLSPDGATFPTALAFPWPAAPTFGPEDAVDLRLQRDGSDFTVSINGTALGTESYVDTVYPGIEIECVNISFPDPGAAWNGLILDASITVGSQTVSTDFTAEPWQPADVAPTERDGFTLGNEAHIQTEEPDSDIEDRVLNGPYGIMGRPRVADVQWLAGKSGCASLLLRFDATDQRMVVLDAFGTPGSGTQTATITPTTSNQCRTYPRCYPMCYDQNTGTEEPEVTLTQRGTECTGFTVCFYGQLTDPVLENVTTGQTVGLTGTISETAAPVCIDTEQGTAMQGGASRTHLITGNARMQIVPGDNEFRLTSFSSSDNGYAEVTWNDVVISA